MSKLLLKHDLFLYSKKSRLVLLDHFVLGIKTLINRDIIAITLQAVPLKNLYLLEELICLGTTESVFCKTKAAWVKPWRELSAWRSHTRIFKGVQILRVQVIEINLTSLVFLGLSRMNIIWDIISIRHWGLAKYRCVLCILIASNMAYLGWRTLIWSIHLLIGNCVCC